MTDLTTEEQAHVRAALRFLRARCGGWMPLAKAIRSTDRGLRKLMAGATVTASIAMRVARLADQPVSDVLGGAYPPVGTCPHCGQTAAPR